jgi:hypothetical protein
LGLESLTCLTPADFALVRRKVRLLALDPDPTALFRMLRQENALKPQSGLSKGVVRTMSNYGK